jgi:hypothetical protein
MAEDAESAGGITESRGGLLGGTPFDVKGTQGLVLALFRVLRLQEKGGRVC